MWEILDLIPGPTKPNQRTKNVEKISEQNFCEKYFGWFMCKNEYWSLA